MFSLEYAMFKLCKSRIGAEFRDETLSLEAAGIFEGQALFVKKVNSLTLTFTSRSRLPSYHYFHTHHDNRPLMHEDAQNYSNPYICTHDLHFLPASNHSESYSRHSVPLFDAV